MRYNEHIDLRPSPMLEACSDSERARAQVVIDACAHKPVKVLDKAYWLANPPKYGVRISPFDTREERSERKREALAVEMREYLRKNGRQTTSRLSEVLRVSHHTIIAARVLIKDISCEIVAVSRGRAGVLMWSIVGNRSCTTDSTSVATS